MSATQSLPRITARVDAETQALLSRATALAGISSINSFVLSAALEKAKQLIEHEQVIALGERDALLFAEALDRPAIVHPRLQQAARRYQEQSTS